MRKKLTQLTLLLFLLATQIFYGQEKNVTGKVLDQEGKALLGASVIVKETNKGTQTDANGNFTIKVSPTQTLLITYLGLKPQEISGGASDFTITLEDNAKAIDAIVVTALGIKRKPDEITASTHIVKTGELNQAKATNAAIGLIGKVSGLQINTVNNGVNPDTRIQLRGFRSISGNNEALIVINGVVSTAGAFAELNPEIIESVNIMKGSSGAALYGSQGSNGVIIVTTKKGNKNAEKFKVTLNSSFSFDQLAYIPEVQTRFGQGYQGAQDFTENTNWGPELDGSLQPTGLAQNLYTYEARKNNIKDFFNIGSTALNSVAISSGDENGYMTFAVGNQNTEGIIPGDVFKKNNFNLSAGKTAGKLSVSGNMRYTASNANTAGGVESSIYNSLLQVPVNVPISEFSSGNQAEHWTYWELSPFWRLKNERRQTKAQTFEGVAELNYKFNKNISAIYRGSFRSVSSNSSRFFNGYTQPVVYWDSPMSYTSSYFASNDNSRRIYSDIMLNFDYDLTDDISFKANIGNNITNFETNFLSMEGQNLIVPGLYNISNITGNATPTDFKSRQRGYAYFANVDLGYKDFLFLNLTGRKEWTSVLSKNNNSFFYPSAGMSFIPTKAFEGFGGDILNYMKVSASIVKVGNAVVSPYDINDRFGTATGAGFPYADINSFVQNLNITDRNLVNEDNLSTELNLNLEFLKRRITLDASYYSSKNSNQIIEISPSTASGANAATINVGETKSTGLELDLGLTPFKTKDFSWDLKLSYSAPKTTVTKVSENSKEVPVGQFLGTVGIKAIEGQQFPMIVGTGYARDENGNVIIDAATGDPLKASNVNLGKTTPDYILGLTTNMKYKNVKLSAVFDYRTGHVFYAGTKDDLIQNGSDVVTAENGREPFIFPNSVIETAPGVYTANTSVTTSGDQNYFTGIYREIDENFVLDATAFKCREIALSYDFSKKALNNTFLDSLSIGFNVRNAFMVLPKENRHYSDPEFSFTTGNNVGLSTSSQGPSTRTYGFNVNISF
ncbi:SusC/RagA family TonB-linked outer membrane protein [Flavobacterium urocaniciphilum]|uniref:TonB-linked outer membrane protein, SusC/RagA family n=1 Tax=Flavobacterium urocaniciphilum TaxID=1299341 RepID=A0A1H9C6T6_9FLAO|nr:SusC/RagA family TonB-linked outer membrane protein [Flavobacterium urocaniciphilum]SEP96543.1 TonB-linked outer membrane protein, SusC/RagA family [Flavobacterium urocaniciphilum]